MASRRVTSISTALALALALVFASARRAAAHDVRGEVVFLDIGEHAVGAEIQIPPLQLAAARGTPLTPGEDLRPYVREHLVVETQDGRPFEVQVERVGLEKVQDGEAIVAHARLIAPDGASARWLSFDDEIVLHRVVTHNVYLFVRRDLRAAALGDAPWLAGIGHYQQRRILVDRTAGGAGTAFRTMVKLGVRHIAEGPDHLLFLATLLLIAPAGASAGRWVERVTGRTSAWRVAKVVTAFTVGHSLTLVAASLGAPTPPSQLVETIVALSILVSAVHAWRPLYPGREFVVAGVFGLFHGLAFAEALRGFGYDGATLAIALVGFNVGVETAQLAVVAGLVPCLIVLGRGSMYPAVRQVGSLSAGLMALVWMAGA